MERGKKGLAAAMNTNWLDLIICLFHHSLLRLPSQFDQSIKDSFKRKNAQGGIFLGFQFLIYVDSRRQLGAVLKNSAGMALRLYLWS